MLPRGTPVPRQGSAQASSGTGVPSRSIESAYSFQAPEDRQFRGRRALSAPVLRVTPLIPESSHHMLVSVATSRLPALGPNAFERVAASHLPALSAAPFRAQRSGECGRHRLNSMPLRNFPMRFAADGAFRQARALAFPRGAIRADGRLELSGLCSGTDVLLRSILGRFSSHPNQKAPGLPTRRFCKLASTPPASPTAPPPSASHSPRPAPRSPRSAPHPGTARSATPCPSPSATRLPAPRFAARHR